MCSHQLPEDSACPGTEVHASRGRTYESTHVPIHLRQQIMQMKRDDVPEGLCKQIIDMVYSSLCSSTM